MKRGSRAEETENNGSNYPDWYWVRGLHDAQITSVEELELPNNYKLRNPIRNMLIIRLDSKQALFDYLVKEIKLYNYKIITSEISSSDLQKSWWLSDRLTNENDKYRLNISLKRVGKQSIEDLEFVVQFSTAEVTRS